MSRGKQTKEQRLLQANSRLKNENAKLRLELKTSNSERDEKIAILEEKLEKALLYIEELQKYVFRGKKKKTGEDSNDDKHGKPKGRGSGGSKRSNSSYRRPLPKEEDVTDEKSYHMENCPRCNSKLSKLKILEFFEEDILPIAEWHKALKKITRIKITTGYCPACNKRVSGLPIPKQKAVLGQNIRQLMVFQNTIQQLSYSQIIDFTKSCLRIDVSDGEIAHILNDQAHKLKPAFEDLLASLREQPALHMDETGWNIACHDAFSGNYIWAMAGVSGTDVAYAFGKNRGMGSAAALLGGGFHGVGITDDYNAYKNIFVSHALCWSHPDRKFRDLENSEKLSKKKKAACSKTSRAFSKLYKEVREIASSVFVKEERMKAKAELMEKFKKIAAPNKYDPEKLAGIKKRLLEQIECYFICITTPNIPPDNNKAERALRHLVIKRKKSFGSKTARGAEMMSTLYSVAMSLWRRSKENFFQSYNEALSV